LEVTISKPNLPEVIGFGIKFSFSWIELELLLCKQPANVSKDTDILQLDSKGISEYFWERAGVGAGLTMNSAPAQIMPIVINLSPPGSPTMGGDYRSLR
jgi:hypothetical protein